MPELPENIPQQLTALEYSVKELSNKIDTQAAENAVQASQIKKLLRRSKAQFDKATILLIGGFAAILIMLTRINLESEAGIQLTQGLLKNLFDIIPVVATVGAGGLVYAKNREESAE